MSTSATCRSCGASVEVPAALTIRDVLRGRCAMRDDAAPAAPPARPVRLVPGRGHAKRRARSAKKSVGLARWILLVLALLVGFYAAVTAWTNTEEVAELRRAAATLGADTLLPFEDGQSMTVGEILEQVEREAWIANLLTFGYAVMLLGLWIWSLRAPYPAIAVALGLYLLLVGADAILDPSSLMTGIFVKAFVILGLLAGFVAARQNRGSQEEEPGR